MAVPPISTTHLLYLREVADAGSFTDAAERIGVTQSALSQGMAELERRLGVRLFERQGRRRVPTDDAAEVIAWARATLAAGDEVVGRLRSRSHGEGVTLRLGLIDTAAVVTFAPTVDATHRRLGRYLRIEVAPSSHLVRRTLNGDLDAAIVVGGNSEQLAAGAELAAVDLLSEPLWIVRPAGQSEPPAWVLPPRGSTTRSIIDAAMARRFHGQPAVDVVMESHNPTVLAHMAVSGFGWTVLPNGGLPTDDHDRRIVVEPEPLSSRHLVLVRRSAALDHPHVERFVQDWQSHGARR